MGVDNFEEIENMPQDLAITLSAYKQVAENLMQEFDKEDNKITKAIERKQKITEIPSIISSKMKQGVSTLSSLKSHVLSKSSKKSKQSDDKVKICPRCHKSKRSTQNENNSTVKQLLEFAHRRDDRLFSFDDNERDFEN